MKKIIISVFILLITLMSMGKSTSKKSGKNVTVAQVFGKVKSHQFHPLNEENSMTLDRDLKTAGIANINDNDWRVRLLAVRDLVRAGVNNVDELKKGLTDENINVRQISAMALGILRAKEAVAELEKLVRKDDIAMVRSQAVIALGQMESKQSLDLLRKKLKDDPSRDVRHQCELAIYQIENKMGGTDKQLAAYLSLDESTFETIEIGSVVPDFVLEDTESKEWHLSQFKDKKWIVLIWVFADWCPVCHGEFHDLMKMKQEFKNAGVKVFTVETHDLYRGRVMVGKELEPEYWFAKESFKDAYTSQIWWPHLLDRAGTIGAMYGADPLTFSVHAEYINRPTTVIIDPKSVVRFIYPGTFWGDRPTIEKTLDMIKTGDFEFKHPRKLKTEN